MAKMKPRYRRSRTVVKMLKLNLESLVFSYKEPDLLRKFITEQGSILPRVETGLSGKLQKNLAREIKRARHLALLPFTQTLDSI